MAVPWLLPTALLGLWSLQNPWLIPPAVTTLLIAGIRAGDGGLSLGSRSISALKTGDDRLWMTTKNGKERPVTLLPESRIAHGWIWLSMRVGRHHRTLLLSDRGGFRNTDPVALRRLRVWLRFSHPVHDTQRPGYR